MEKTKICRFCLNNDNTTEYMDIFNNVASDFLLKVQNCLSFEILKNDGLPILACLECIKKIDLFDNFKRMCCNSYEHLIRITSKEKLLKGDFEITTATIEGGRNDIKQSNLKNDSEDDDNNYDNSGYLTDDLTPICNRVRNQKPPAFGYIDDSVIEIIGNNIYICDICKQPFHSFFDYYDHQETHNGEFIFKCDKCDMVFNNRKLLVEHDYKHRVPCEICRMEVLPSSLRAHLLIHTDIHKCSVCNMRHTSKASLEKHIQARHIGQKGFVCHICGKQNSCQSSMNRHMAYHSNERPYKCKYCDFTAKSLNIVQVHASRKHFAEKCVCEICAKIFKSQPSLMQHRKRIHSNRRHTCSVCNKEFIEKYNLNKHMKKHIGQRLHECKVCQKEFFTVRKLKDHMHSHKEGCVSCPKCGKEFFYKKYFNKHVEKCNKYVKTDSSIIIGCYEIKN